MRTNLDVNSDDDFLTWIEAVLVEMDAPDAPYVASDYWPKYHEIASTYCLALGHWEIQEKILGDWFWKTSVPLIIEIHGQYVYDVELGQRCLIEALRERFLLLRAVITGTPTYSATKTGKRERKTHQ